MSHAEGAVDPEHWRTLSCSRVYVRRPLRRAGCRSARSLRGGPWRRGPEGGTTGQDPNSAIRIRTRQTDSGQGSSSAVRILNRAES